MFSQEDNPRFPTRMKPPSFAVPRPGVTNPNPGTKTGGTGATQGSPELDALRDSVAQAGPPPALGEMGGAHSELMMLLPLLMGGQSQAGPGREFQSPDTSGLTSLLGERVAPPIRNIMGSPEMPRIQPGQGREDDGGLIRRQTLLQLLSGL